MNSHPDMPQRPDPAQENAALPRARRRPWLQLVLAAVLLVAGFAGYRAIMALAPEPKVRQKVEAPLPVRTVAVKLQDVRPRWRFYGHVQAERRSALQMPVSGRIVWVSDKLKDGAQVAAGEELLRIDDLPYRAALAQARAQAVEARQKVKSEERLLKRAEEQAAIAARELARTERLVARGTLPKARLDEQRRAHLQAVEKLEQRRHALAAAKAALERAEWALKKAQDDLANTTLRAPFAGVLTEVRAQVGQQAAPGTALATLVSDTAPEVRFAVPEEHLLSLRKAGEEIIGRKVRLIVRTADGEAALNGRIARRAAQVEAGKGQAQLYAALEDAKAARWLLPGTFVEVVMPGPLYRQVALLPEAALQDGRTVAVVDNGALKLERVRVLGMQQDKAIIAGLQAGALAVRHRLSHPRNGQKVRVLKDGETDVAEKRP